MGARYTAGWPDDFVLRYNGGCFFGLREFGTKKNDDFFCYTIIHDLYRNFCVFFTVFRTFVRYTVIGQFIPYGYTVKQGFIP